MQLSDVHSSGSWAPKSKKNETPVTNVIEVMTTTGADSVFSTDMVVRGLQSPLRRL